MGNQGKLARFTEHKGIWMYRLVHDIVDKELRKKRLERSNLVGSKIRDKV